MPFNTTYANNILNWALGKATSPASHDRVWIGLCSNDPEEAGGAFTELTGKGYSRVLINQSDSEYPGLIASASNRAITNSKQIGFTKATGGAWVDAKGYGLFITATGGTPFFYAKLKEAVSTPEGAVFLFDPGELKIDFQTTDVDIT